MIRYRQNFVDDLNDWYLYSECDLHLNQYYYYSDDDYLYHNYNNCLIERLALEYRRHHSGNMSKHFVAVDFDREYIIDLID